MDWGVLRRLFEANALPRDPRRSEDEQWYPRPDEAAEGLPGVLERNSALRDAAVAVTGPPKSPVARMIVGAKGNLTLDDSTRQMLNEHLLRWLLNRYVLPNHKK